MGKKSRAKKERKAFEALTASMPDLGGDAPLDYDDAGWPAGREGEQTARILMEDWLNRLDEDGWDQPNSVMLVTRPDATAADFAAEGIDVGQLGEMLIEQQGQDPREVFAGAFMRTGTMKFAAHPVDAFWGQSAEPDVSAVGVALETWVSENATVRPSQDPHRSEMRVLQLLTRSGQFFQMSRERGSDEIQWGPGTQGRIGIVLHQFLGVPVPAAWPRTSMQRYCGLIASQHCAQMRTQVELSMGADGLGPRVAGIFVLGVALQQLWDITREGELLPVRARALLRQGRENPEVYNDDEDALEDLIEVIASGFASRDWSDYVSSPQIQDATGDDTIVPFYEPHDWASDDTIAAFVGTAFSDIDDKPLEVLPKQARKSAKDMLRRLGLT